MIEIRRGCEGDGIQSSNSIQGEDTRGKSEVVLTCTEEGWTSG